MVRDGFDTSLKELKQDVIYMIDKVDNIIEETVRCFAERDIEGARAVYKLDDEVDNAFYLIESKCIELLALQQPKAHDLRIVFAIMGTITDLERMGDYAVNIVKEVILLGDEQEIRKYKEIIKMKDIIRGMISMTRQSFIDEDQALATRACSEDDLVDELYKDVYNEVLLKISDNREAMTQGARILFIGRYLERIADHITNVCEAVVYIATGERVELN